ncbi:MAG TPA: hypothetical protein VHQ65_11320 [Thermoanaerobaculia bacterium]|nr:hypothetical protein [Thermoanaerobaculia bacterium]
MTSFEPGFLQRQPLTHGLLRSVGAIRQSHGREELFRQQAA